MQTTEQTDQIASFIDRLIQGAENKESRRCPNHLRPRGPSLNSAPAIPFNMPMPRRMGCQVIPQAESAS